MFFARVDEQQFRGPELLVEVVGVFVTTDEAYLFPYEAGSAWVAVAFLRAAILAGRKCDLR